MRQKREEKKLGVAVVLLANVFFGGGKCPNLGVVNVRILGVVNVRLANNLTPKNAPLLNAMIIFQSCERSCTESSPEYFCKNISFLRHSYQNVYADTREFSPKSWTTTALGNFTTQPMCADLSLKRNWNTGDWIQTRWNNERMESNIK